MLTEVTKLFDDHLKTKLSSKPDVLKWLLTHERKATCIQNVCEQIRIAEIGVKNMDVWKFKTLINGVAEMFGSTALEQKRQELMSHADKKLHEMKHQQQQEIEKLFNQLNKPEPRHGET